MQVLGLWIGQSFDNWKLGQDACSLEALILKQVLGGSQKNVGRGYLARFKDPAYKDSYRVFTPKP